MKKMIGLLLILALAFALVGCYKHTYNVGAGAPNGKVVYEKWHSHWFFGIIGVTELDIKEICQSGDATIHDEVSFLNGLVGAFVGIIYYPTTATIQCKGGNRAELDLTTDQMAKIVTDPGFLYWVEDVAPESMNDAMKAVQNARLFLEGQAQVAQLH